MNQTSSKQLSVTRPAACLARIVAPHGYRVDGDHAHLHAKFTVVEQDAHQRQWALQLWACPIAPTSGKDLAGQVIAEVALPPMSEAADEHEHMEMSGFANIPAGAGAHFMALVLAAGRPGQFDEVHDVVAYPREQRFLQPRMSGTVSYSIDGDQVRLVVDQIENPRSAANRSGTLALELWALPAPFAGGSSAGHRLAGTVIGTLSGKHEFVSTSFTLPFAPPPAGAWSFVLMLREWTVTGYVTRDFIYFANPVIYGPAPETATPEIEASKPMAAAPIKAPTAVATVTTPTVKAAATEAKVIAPPAEVSSPKPEVRAAAAPTAVATVTAPTVKAAATEAKVIAPPAKVSPPKPEVRAAAPAKAPATSKRSRKSR